MCHKGEFVPSGKTGWIDAVGKQSWSSVFTVKYDIVKLRNDAKWWENGYDHEHRPHDC